MMNENLIKASVAAKQLGKSSTTIRRMLADGRLLGEKNGARYWVNRASLDQFMETGDGRIDQTEPKPNTESDISDTITELIGKELVPLEGSLPTETSETGDDTANFDSLKGQIQFDAVAFFDRCKDFPFSSLSILARCVDFERNDYVERLLERRFRVMHDKIPMIDMLGDNLWTIIQDYFEQGYFPEDPFYPNEKRRVFRDDILWRLELRENTSSVRPDAFCFPFKAVYDDGMLLELETQGAKEVINAARC
jgi:excisionase family DNA binding protein